MPTRTELIWDGKYDATGKRVAPLRTALPFQTVETVNESAQERVKSLFGGTASEQPWRNRLIWGDKKYVLPSLLAEFAGKVNLIYIDPPFDTGADFSFTATVPEYNGDDDGGIDFTKEPSLIEQKAYRDTWGRGIDSYLQWFYETVVLLHDLLAETGTIYVHCDWRVDGYIRIALEEVFGRENFMNALIWKRDSAAKGAKKTARQWSREGDSIIAYRMGERAVYKSVYLEELTETQLREYMYSDPDGRKFKKVTLGDYSETSIEAFRKQSLIYTSSSGREYKKYYLDEARFAIGSIWTDIVNLSKGQKENVGYPTQKPEALIDRIVRASSNEGDLVLDCFVGSGTTAVVAEKLNRRWIACDLGRFAIHTSRKRLLGIPDVRPFVVQNLGKYERQLWQTGQFAADGPESPEQAAARHRAYTEFILSLYHAQPIHSYTWLHGTRNGRMVHVGGVEAPVTVNDVQNMAVEFKKAIGTGKDAPTTNGLDVLGWDFAFELNEIAKQQAQAANIQIAFKRIPRDVMDKRAVAQGDIHFFELAALAVKTSVKGKLATLTLTDFVIPPDDVPEEVRKSVTHWSQWIDYWAVDWTHETDTFHNQWQTFRTRKSPKLDLSATNAYAEPGEYRVVVKVIDILGNDTTKTVSVKVK